MSVSYLYMLMMGLAIAAGVFLSRDRQRGLGLSPGERLAILLGAFCGAMLGAKLPFVLSDWGGFLSGAAWFTSGKTILCGLAGGYFGVEAAKWSLDIHVRTGDSFAVPAAVTIGIGRWACFFGGCCYGTPTSLPWGVRFPDPASPGSYLPPCHPTQIYESAFHLAAALILWQFERRGLFRGQLIKVYIISYCAFRFLTEYIRPEAPLAGGLTGYQCAAVVLAALFAWLAYRDAHRLKDEAQISLAAPA